MRAVLLAFAVVTFGLAGYGLHSMSDASDAGLLLFLFSSALFVIAIIGVLPNIKRKEVASKK